MAMGCVSVDALLIPVGKSLLITNIFRNGGMMLLTLYLQLNKYKCV